jgi:hypothetical protein
MRVMTRMAMKRPKLGERERERERGGREGGER